MVATEEGLVVLLEDIQEGGPAEKRHLFIYGLALGNSPRKRSCERYCIWTGLLVCFVLSIEIAVAQIVV